MGAQSCRHGYQPCPASLLPLPATIALLAEDGHLVSLGSDLADGTSQAPSSGSPLLQERGTYVLVQIISKWGLRLAPFPLQFCGNVRGGTTVQRPPKARPSSPLWPKSSPDPFIQ